MAAVDYFLKIDGVDGESTDSKHKGEIELESFSWGASQSGTKGAGTGLASGKVSVQDFQFSMKISKASPKLFASCCTGDRFKTAVLVARKAGKMQQEYMKMTLSDCLVSKYQAAGSQSEILPIDQISLSFSKIEVEYKEQKADGSLAGATKAGWDLKINKKV